MENIFNFFISPEERSKQARDDFKFIFQTEANKTWQWPSNQSQAVRKGQIKPEEHILRVAYRGLVLALRFHLDYAAGVIVSFNSCHPQFTQTSRPAYGFGLIQLGKDTGGEAREMWTWATCTHIAPACPLSLREERPRSLVPVRELDHGAHVGRGVPSVVCSFRALWHSWGGRAGSVLVSKAGLGPVPQWLMCWMKWAS